MKTSMKSSQQDTDMYELHLDLPRNNCLKKPREGKLELNICHPSHEYFEVPE
jgi:hypothetical protein